MTAGALDRLKTALADRYAIEREIVGPDLSRTRVTRIKAASFSSEKSLGRRLP